MPAESARVEISFPSGVATVRSGPEGHDTSRLLNWPTPKEQLPVPALCQAQCACHIAASGVRACPTRAPDEK